MLEKETFGTSQGGGRTNTFDGEIEHKECLKDGLFGTDTAVFPADLRSANYYLYHWDPQGNAQEPRCLQRSLKYPDTPMSATTFEEYAEATFCDFSTIEIASVHVKPHSYIGGQMTRHLSPMDPLFWVHHANVDRKYVFWQELHPFVDHYEDCGYQHSHWFAPFHHDSLLEGTYAVSNDDFKLELGDVFPPGDVKPTDVLDSSYFAHSCTPASAVLVPLPSGQWSGFLEKESETCWGTSYAQHYGDLQCPEVIVGNEFWLTKDVGKWLAVYTAGVEFSSEIPRVDAAQFELQGDAFLETLIQDALRFSPRQSITVIMERLRRSLLFAFDSSHHKYRTYLQPIIDALAQPHQDFPPLVFKTIGGGVSEQWVEDGHFAQLVKRACYHLAERVHLSSPDYTTTKEPSGNLQAIFAIKQALQDFADEGNVPACDEIVAGVQQHIPSFVFYCSSTQ